VRRKRHAVTAGPETYASMLEAGHRAVRRGSSHDARAHFARANGRGPGLDQPRDRRRAYLSASIPKYPAYPCNRASVRASRVHHQRRRSPSSARSASGAQPPVRAEHHAGDQRRLRRALHLPAFARLDAVAGRGQRRSTPRLKPDGSAGVLHENVKSSP
jgi:hypothetical protein